MHRNPDTRRISVSPQSQQAIFLVPNHFFWLNVLDFNHPSYKLQVQSYAELFFVYFLTFLFVFLESCILFTLEPLRRFAFHVFSSSPLGHNHVSFLP